MIKLNNITDNIIGAGKNLIKKTPDGGVDVVKTLSRPLKTFKNADAVIPTMIIECGVTGGRTYHAYKRGGKTEGRERFIEQGTSAVVWLFGVKVLNKVGDWFGKNVLKLPGLDVDTGADALRQPFKNLVKDKKTAASVFKFSKIIMSCVATSLFMGAVLPKIIHKMTNKSLAKENVQNNQNAQQNNTAVQTTQTVQNPTVQIQTTQVVQNNNTAQTQSSPMFMSPLPKQGNEKKLSLMDNFVEGIKNDNAKPTSFKGSVAETLLKITDNLENNNKWRLMSTDTGVVAGRTLNGRNKYESLEFLFRDTSSIYFYMFATPHVVKLANWLSKNTDIHPEAVIKTREYLTDELAREGGRMSSAEFIKKAIGEKGIVPDGIFSNEKGKNAIKAVDFDKFCEKFADKLTKEQIEKLKGMTELQPIVDGKRLLSKMQIEDGLSNGGWLTNPKFIKEAISAATDGKSDDPRKFISMENLEGIRKSFDGFAQNIAKYADKHNNGEVTAEIIKKAANNNVAKNLAFVVLGVATSIFGLAYLIPKIQYKITEKLTGSKAFPGTATYNNQQSKKA